MIQAFSRDLVRRITGLSFWQLDYWDRLDIVRASIVAENEPGLPRLYSFRDVLKLKVAAELRHHRWLPTQIREAIIDLERRGMDDPLATVRFVADPRGGDVLLIDPSSDTAMDAKHRDQKAFDLNLDMKVLGSELVAKISDLTQRTPGEIVQLRSVLSSQPVIKGTRIPTEKIALLARQGLDRRAIVAALPSLSEADVDAALAFEERKARERRTA